MVHLFKPMDLSTASPILSQPAWAPFRTPFSRRIVPVHSRESDSDRKGSRRSSCSPPLSRGGHRPDRPGRLRPRPRSRGAGPAEAAGRRGRRRGRPRAARGRGEAAGGRAAPTTTIARCSSSEKPQFVVVAPRWLDGHKEMILACAEQGVLGIFCEKPLAPDLASCDAIVDGLRAVARQARDGLPDPLQPAVRAGQAS